MEATLTQPEPTRAPHATELTVLPPNQFEGDRHIQRSAVAPSWIVSARLPDAVVHREFADRLFGGMAQAFESACRWRDAQPWGRPLRVNEQLTVNEVTRYETLLPGQSRISAFWHASGVSESGERWSRKFSVNFWGEEVAREKAMRVRARAREGVIYR